MSIARSSSGGRTQNTETARPLSVGAGPVGAIEEAGAIDVTSAGPVGGDAVVVTAAGADEAGAVETEPGASVVTPPVDPPLPETPGPDPPLPDPLAGLTVDPGTTGGPTFDPAMALDRVGWVGEPNSVEPLESPAPPEPMFTRVVAGDIPSGELAASFW